MTADTAMKAHLLLEQRRVIPVSVDPPGMLVRGFRGDYKVWADFTGVFCDCYAGAGSHGEAMCCHAAAAMVVWSDLVRSETSPPRS